MDAYRAIVRFFAGKNLSTQGGDRVIFKCLSLNQIFFGL